MANLNWYVEVDWDDSGSFEARDNEAARVIGLKISRGRRSYLHAGNERFESLGIGRATITLDNHDRRYDTWYTSSPLYPYVEPGKFVRISVKEGAGGTQYYLFSGTIQDIQELNAKERRQVVLVVEDGIRWLRDQTVVTGTIREDTLIDTPLADILAAASWPSRWGTDLGLGADYVEYWWGSGNSAMSEIDALVMPEFGYFWHAADGKARFKSRQTVESSILTLTQDQILSDIYLAQPWENLRNQIKVKFYPKKEEATGVIWTLDAIPRILAGETYEVWASYGYGGIGCAAKNVITPVATTDYTANTDAGGGGTDITADIAITITKFAESAKLEIKNNGASNGYLTKMQLRGDAITALNPAMYVAEGAGYTDNPRTFSYEAKWHQNAYTIKDTADLLLSYLENPHPYPEIKIVQRPTLQYSIDLFDVITLNIAQKGINEDFRVVYIEHNWLTENGQSVETLMRCEPYESLGSFWVFPTRIGETSIFGV